MFDPQPAAPVISVSELNRLARLALERALPVTWIAGEVSNLSRATSGHWYFSLKDASAAVRCAMFRNRNQFLDWQPENGMQVEVRAQATLYEPRGDFQLSVEAMRRAGRGALFEAFQRLKEKLEREGLFDPARKRPLPALPRCIGVVTSPRAAALRDVLSTLRRRWPLARVVLYPAPVQGEGAAARIAAAVRLAGERRDCEVLLVVRGGGSIEDLWSFNDEAVARAIAACTLPVVSGVGHETDFSIADFAADLRAATPTAAAQLATPDARDLARRSARLGNMLGAEMRRRLVTAGQHLDGLARRLRHPSARLEAQLAQLGHLRRRLAMAGRMQLERAWQRADRLGGRWAALAPRPERAYGQVADLARRLRQVQGFALTRRAERLAALSAHLVHLNPEAVLGRGYAIARASDGKVILDSRAVAPGELVSVTLARGWLAATVIKREA